MHKVVRGDCISSLSVEHGLLWQTIWEHPENAELRSLRKEPNILMEGDEVFIPEREGGVHSGATEKRHKFRWKNAPAMLRVRVLRAGKAVADTKYTLVIDGAMRTGTTTGEGAVPSTRTSGSPSASRRRSSRRRGGTRPSRPSARSLATDGSGTTGRSRSWPRSSSSKGSSEGQTFE